MRGTRRRFGARLSSSRGTHIAGPQSVMRTPNLLSKMNIRARHAAVQNVAENRDVPAFEFALAVANGERVKQSLRGMFVRAVAGVQHGNLQALGDEFGRAGRAVANHDAVGTHRFERANRVEQRFALLQAGGFGLQIHGIGAEAGGGGGEADARARGGLEKGHGDGLAAQRGQFLQRMALEFLEWLGLIENKRICSRVRSSIPSRCSRR